jgi:PEP-CTERM motif
MGCSIGGCEMRCFLLLAAALIAVIPKAQAVPIPTSSDPFAGILTIFVPTEPPTGTNAGQSFYGQFPTLSNFGTITAQIGTAGVLSGNVGFFSPGSGYIAQAFPASLNSAPLSSSIESVFINNAFTSGFFPGRFVTGVFSFSYEFDSTLSSFVYASGPITTFIEIASSENQESFAFSGTLDAEHIDAVPEPSTWAMLLIGFAGIGLAANWRRGRMRRAMMIKAWGLSQMRSQCSG